jgi:acetyl esterase/lipase
MPSRVFGDSPPAADGRISYGDQASQFVDFRRPRGQDQGEARGEAPAPLAVMIHGGFWRVRYGLEHSAHVCAAISSAGFATANLEYRRVGEPGGGWPGTLEDVTRGVAFAREHAREFGGDRARTFVLGHSAGGHLALWVAGRFHDLKRAVGLGAVANLELAFSLALSDCAVAEFLGGTPVEVPERYAEADPARPTPVPRVLIHGDADDIVPVELTRRFAAPATRIEIPGADHFAVVDPQHPAWQFVLAELKG